MKDYKIILTAIFLLGITIFGVFKYILALKEKNDLLNNLNQIKMQVNALETEEQYLLQTIEKEKQFKEKLIQENTGLKEGLRSHEEKLTQLKQDFSQAQKTMEELNSQISALKDESDKLRLQLTEVLKEKDNLQARLGSISELKKAIRELKRQVRKVGVEIKKKTMIEKIIEGNCGFLVKDGKSTYPAKVKIEVNPANINP